jgi:hypothetical protein
VEHSTDRKHTEPLITTVDKEKDRFNVHFVDTNSPDFLPPGSDMSINQFSFQDLLDNNTTAELAQASLNVQEIQRDETPSSMGAKGQRYLYNRAGSSFLGNTYPNTDNTQPERDPARPNHLSTIIRDLSDFSAIEYWNDEIENTNDFQNIEDESIFKRWCETTNASEDEFLGL